MNTKTLILNQFKGCGNLALLLALIASPAIAEPLSSTNSKAGDQPTELSVAEIAAQSKLPELDAMDQVTSVSQLSDVQPTDWAFQALQSLVERYGCIAGYPDGTYRGNRAMTRYEFAAGLNACMDRVNELIAAATADLVRKEDLATLKKLQDEFAAELKTLRGRVDALEARTATLEAQQFSTTTKLSGEVIFSVGAAYGAKPAGGFPTGAAGTDANVTFNSRVRLNLLTSFSGKDLLITGLQAHNFTGTNYASTLGYADPVFGTASNARLGYEPQFPSVNPSNLGAIGTNALQVYKLLYVFPVADRLTLFAGTAAETTDAFPTILPFSSESQGAISRFAQVNPAIRVSGGTSGMGLASAAGFIWSISDKADLRALYASVNGAVPVNFPGVTAGSTPLGAGLFNGSNIIATQLTLKPTNTLDIGLNYAYSYHQLNILGTGLFASDIGSIPGVAATNPLTMHSIGATLAWRLSPQVTFATYGSYIFANAVNNVSGQPSTSASATFNSWLVGLHFSDIGKKGNTAGLIFGQPLTYNGVSGSTGGVAAIRPDNTTPYHLEGYFNFRVSDNISITPGVFFVFNPEGSSNNRTTTVGVLRTSFSF